MEKVCKECKKIFQALTIRKEYCSVSCRNKYTERLRLPRIRLRQQLYKPRKKTVQKCQLCKKKFMAWKNRLYCSKLCRERKRDRSNYNRQRLYEVSNNFQRKFYKKTTALNGPVGTHEENNVKN